MKLGRRSLFALTLLLSMGAAIVFFGGWFEDDAPRTWPRDELLDAIRWVESRDVPNPSDGDAGLAIGPYQIHEVYWRDATAFDPELGGSYQDCRRRDYAESVIDAYMRRWAPEAWRIGDGETVARVHNGGPQGATKDGTLRYWQRVLARLDDS